MHQILLIKTIKRYQFSKKNKYSQIVWARGSEEPSFLKLVDKKANDSVYCQKGYMETELGCKKQLLINS